MIASPAGAKKWVVNGWSVWDFGDELTVHRGAKLYDEIVARVPPEIVCRMSEDYKQVHIQAAIEAIRESDEPEFNLLWRVV